MSLMFSLANLKIHTKVLSGFGCLLFVLLIVGGVGFVALRHIGKANEIVVQRTKVSAIASEIQLDFTTARRFVREFAHTGDPATAAQGDAALAHVKEAVRRGLAGIEAPELHAKTNNIEEVANAYTATFQRVKAAKQQALTLQAEVLDRTGIQLLQAFTNLADAASGSSDTNVHLLILDARFKLMSARLDANKALARTTETLFQQAENSFARLDKTIASIASVAGGSELKPLFEETSTLAARYTDTFHRW